MTDSVLTDSPPVTTTTDQAAAAPADYSMEYMGATFTARADGTGTFMATAAGPPVLVPPDLPQRAQRYQLALESGRQVVKFLAGIYLPEVREFMSLVRPAYEVDPYAVGGELHEHAVIAEALEAFGTVINRGRAADIAHRQAATTAAAAVEAVPGGGE